MSIGFLILMAYLAGCLGFLVPTARFIHREMNDYGSPSPMDYAMVALIAIGAIWFWPLYIPGAWLVAILRADDDEKAEK